VVERGREEGGYWVIRRIVARASFTSALRLVGVPPQGDMVITFQNYRINRGIEPGIFTGGGGGKD